MQSVNTVLAAAFILAATLSASRAESGASNNRMNRAKTIEQEPNLDVPLSDTIYQFSAKTSDGDVVKLDKYKYDVSHHGAYLLTGRSLEAKWS